ncbi:MAG: Peptidase M23 family protein [Parcubacteria group bacterium GW2011_GWA2_44_15]|nr:MAG: Peptidase M23 family protein [Parcubacteria group bacterium GW2011_GWA2_44_15]
MTGPARLQQGLKIFILLIVIVIIPIYLIRAENKLLIEPTKVDTIGRSTVLATLFTDTLQEDFFVESSYVKIVANTQNDKLTVSPSALQSRDINDNISWVNYNTEDTSLLARPSGVNTKSNQLTKVTKYVVQFNDSPGLIAQRFGLKLQTILDNNNLSSKSMIKVGQTLWLPPSDGLIYTWTKTSTIAALAKKYKISTTEILRANNLGAADKLAVNEKIVVPGARPDKPTIIVPAKTTTSKTAVASRSRAGGAGALLWPTTATRLTQYFSLRHPGIDIAGAFGLPIYAAADGIVKISQGGWNGGYGIYIIISHGNGRETLYGHMARRAANVGDEVSRGDLIGYMGSTGRSTGPHVHFEVRIFGRRANPFASL